MSSASNSLDFALEPIRQFARIGKHASALAAWYAMHGQTPIAFPALYSPLGAVEERGDFLP